MRRQLLVLITTIQISLIRTLEDTCDTRSGHSCNQMSESLEPEENKMGQYLGSKDNKSIFPQTLEEFGYKFNEDGQMRNIETDEPFKFDVKEGDRAYNQKHYEALGEVITDYVYQLLEEKVKLKKHIVPVDAKEDESKSFIFMSDDAMTNDKLLILIHGSGVVRAGQWARRLIINDDLNSGTMLPFIKRASQEGYGVLITNGNENHVKKNKKRIPIRGSESPEKHFVYVWDNFISKAAAQTVVVVAHSYGGIVIVEGLQHCNGIMERIKAIAFTDSVHSLSHQRAGKKLVRWMKKNSCNWVSSDLALDTPVKSLFGGADCEMVSAGTTKHELTSHVAFDSIFKFFDKKLEAANQADSVETSDNQMDTSENQTDASKNQQDTSENQADASKNNEDSTQNQAASTENQADASQNKQDSSQNQAASTENQADASQNKQDSSQHQAASTENQADVSQNKQDSSQKQAASTENQADESQMETDS